MPRISAFAFLLVLLAACGRQFGGPPLTTTDYKIYEAAMTQRSSLIEVIDTRSQWVERTLPMGTLSGDLHHLYSVSGTQLHDIDPQTGSTLHSLAMPRSYWLPPAAMSGALGGLSQNGRWLALQGWDPEGSSLPNASHFLVVSTGFESEPVRIDLNGWFEFDAISNDGQRLYLIEYLTRGVYRVRVYNVATQMLDPTVVTDKTDPKESMTGQRVMGVPSPDGRWLYSIYIREKDSPFIHVLSLDGPYAFCIDLPGSGYGSDAGAFGWSLALAGEKLYAANAAIGVVDTLSLGNGVPTLTKTARIDSGATTASLIQDVEAKWIGGGALLSQDGSTLVTASGSGISFVDTSTLRVRKQAVIDARVLGLGLTPDGRIVYAVRDDKQIEELSMSSAAVGSIFNPGGGSPMSILAVSGSA